MSRHRDFDAAMAERNREPLTFVLGGITFTVGHVAAGPLLSLAATAQDPTTGDTGAVATMVNLLHSLVSEDQREQFEKALQTVDIPTMVELVSWVIEESTGRPLENVSSSPPRPSPDGTRLRDDSLSDYPPPVAWVETQSG